MNDLTYTENRAFLPLVVVSTFVLLLMSLPFELGKRIVVFSVVIWVMWIALFLVEKIKGAKIADTRGTLVLKLLFAVIISLFFANSIWLSNYLTFNPIDAILRGSIHVDTLYLSTVAESIKNYGYPSILLNDAGFLHYHFGSNFIIATISGILNIPTLSVYNLLYPIIFIPFFSYLLISVIVEIRRYKNEQIRLSVFDYIILASFVMGFLPDGFLIKNAIWKSSVVISESYLIAVTFLLMYIFLLLKLVMMNNRWRKLAIIVLTSFFIFVCSSMKVSVGFILAAGAIYMNFRENTQKFQYWIANILFFAIFIVSYKIFSEAMGENTIYHFLSFALHYIDDPYKWGYIIHYFLISFFTLCFLFYQLSFKASLRETIMSKKVIIEETVIVVFILCLIPSLSLYVPGGSAFYFTSIQELFGICLLLGYNIPDKVKQKIQTKSSKHRNFVNAILLVVSLIIYGNSKGLHSFVEVLNNGVYRINEYEINTPIAHTPEYTLISNMHVLNTIPKKEKNLYGIFLDDSAEIWNYCNDARSAVFFYPALTGIRVLNALYTDGIGIFASNGSYLQGIEWSNYGKTKDIVTEKVDGKINWVSKQTFDEAKEMAKRRNIRYIIYFYNNTYEIIEI